MRHFDMANKQQIYRIHRFNIEIKNLRSKPRVSCDAFDQHPAPLNAAASDTSIDRRPAPSREMASAASTKGIGAATGVAPPLGYRLICRVAGR
jgi:hypothetical protein